MSTGAGQLQLFEVSVALRTGRGMSATKVELQRTAGFSPSTAAVGTAFQITGTVPCAQVTIQS